MGRRIVWYDYESTESESKKDSYFDRVLKYIPSDVIGLWVTGNGFIQGQAGAESRIGLLWLLFVVGLVLSFFWTRQQTTAPSQPMVQRQPTAWQQIILSCGSFAVWVFAIGGPFTALPFYKPVYGSLLLLIYASVIPLLPHYSKPQQ
jgi:hypothetical protein